MPEAFPPMPEGSPHMSGGFRLMPETSALRRPSSPSGNEISGRKDADSPHASGNVGRVDEIVRQIPKLSKQSVRYGSERADLSVEAVLD